MSFFPNAAVSTVGGAKPTVAEQIAGNDGTDTRVLLTDNTGQLKVLVEGGSGTTVSGTVTAVGDAASGAPVAGNPVLVAGQDGTDARTILTDNTGQVKVLVEGGTGIPVTNAGTFAVQAATTIADGADVTLGSKADAKSTATDTTPITAMSVLKQISASVQAPPSQAVTNAGTFAVQAAITAASGALASGSVASGAVVDGAVVTLGSKADAKSTATDTTPVSVVSILKEISAQVQAPPSQAVTNAGTFAVQEATLDGAISGGKVKVSAAAGDVVVEISDGTNIIGTTAHPVQVADQANGPVTPGTAAAKSELQGGVVATAAASGTVGQQMAVQMDVAGCVRINPAGQTGSFKSYTASSAVGVAVVTFTVPAGVKWRVMSSFFQYVTSSQTATRTAVWQARDASGNLLADVFASATQAASITANYTFAPSVVAQGTTQQTAGAPMVSLGPGAEIQFTASNFQTLDQLKLSAICVEEYND